MQDVPISLMAFTLLSGLAAGTFVVVHCACGLARPGELRRSLEDAGSRIAAGISLVMAAALLASLTHLGQPQRFVYGMTHPASWLTQEAWWATAFFVVTAAVAYLSARRAPVPRWLSALGILMAIGMVFSTGMLYATLKAIPAWNSVATVASFLASALLMGAAAAAAVAPRLAGARGSLVKGAVVLSLVFLLLHAATAILVEVQLNLQVSGVTLPGVLILNVLRWLIGLIVPACIFLWMLVPAAKQGQMASLALVAILVGEALARSIFFLRGVHV